LRSTTGVPEGLGRRRKKRGERAQRVSWQHEVRREEAGEAGEQEQGDPKTMPARPSTRALRRPVRPGARHTVGYIACSCM
ncbi:MAG: hypothetical protein AAF471_07405, partial [Myxococcota bacterium]